MTVKYMLLAPPILDDVCTRTATVVAPFLAHPETITATAAYIVCL